MMLTTHPNLKRFFAALVVVDFLMINATVFYIWYNYVNSRKADDPIDNPIPTVSLGFQQNVSDQKASTDELLLEYKSYVDGKYQDLMQKVSSLSADKELTYVYVTPTSGKKSTSASYFTIQGSGSTLRNDWVSLSGTDFYFNKSDFPGIKNVYLEANIKLFNGNGVAYFRLFDVTHGIGVQGSEVQTSSQTSNLVISGEINFWEGNNLYKVQAKSLTADTAVFDSGKLKIISEK